MSKSIMYQISKVGVPSYVNIHICRINVIRKNLKRWMDTNQLTVPQDVLEIYNSPKQNLAPDMENRVTQLCKDGRQIDAISFMKQCMMYYHKKHKFVFGTEIMELLDNETTSFSVLSEVFSTTVEQTEKNLHYFQSSLLKRKQRVTDASTKTNRIGPFNRYVKDQWTTRREELRHICAGSKSTDVMKLLSLEWRSNPTLKLQYSSTPVHVDPNM
jgi:hypothetical protein